MSLHLPSRLAAITLTSPALIETIRAFVTGHRAWDARWEDTLRGAVEVTAERSLGTVPPHQIRAHLRCLEDGTAVGWTALEDDDALLDTPRRPSDVGRHPLLLRALILLADRLLVWNHGHFRLRSATLLEFQQLVGDVAPDQVLMLAAAAERSADGHLVPRPRHLDRRSLEAILTSPLIPAVDLPIIDAIARRGLAEIHRHAGGSAQPALLWLDLLRDPTALARTISRRTDLDHDRRRALLNHSAGLRDARHLRTLLVSALLRAATTAPPSSSDDESRKWWDDWSRDVRRTLATFGAPVRYGESPGRSVDIDPAARLAGGHLAPPASERALLYYAFRLLLQPRHATGPAHPPRTHFLLALHAYIIQQNHLVRALVQPGSDREGLQRFVFDYYRTPLAVGRKRARGTERQATETGRVRWLEARMGPDGVTRKLSHLIESIRTLGDDQPTRLGVIERRAIDCRQPRGEAPGLGVVLHFIRQPERALTPPAGDPSARPGLTVRRSAAFALPPRFSRLRARLWRETFEIMRLDGYRDLAPYLVGLDVAGDETTTPVEVFAPMIRFLRSPFRRRRHTEAELGPLPAVPPLALTCHAGEDFVHLLSGMRAVDETLRFLDMRRGDRLGHALALGIEPQRWADRMGTVVSMPLETRVDDLAWFLDRLSRHGEFSHVARQVERELAGLTRRLYEGVDRGALDDARWDLQFRAWCWRRCDPTDSEGRSAAGLPSDLRLFLRAERDENLAALGEDAQRLWRTHQRSPGVRDRGATLIQVPVRPSWLPAIRRVQVDLIDTLIRRDIAIEINPSSNLAIGPFDDLTEHPVFRWYPPGAARDRAHPFVVVGSDDPGIFATELLHEYAYLARAAEQRGAAPRQVADWLEDLRQTSVMFSFLPATA
ncbi:MAG: hypothetical protein R3F65_19625 [bacterium]